MEPEEEKKESEKEDSEAVESSESPDSPPTSSHWEKTFAENAYCTAKEDIYEQKLYKKHFGKKAYKKEDNEADSPCLKQKKEQPAEPTPAPSSLTGLAVLKAVPAIEQQPPSSEVKTKDKGEKS